jgi:hypothetical protein
MNAHIPQLPVAEAAQDRQICLMFALRDDGCDPSIDETGELSAHGMDHLPKIGRVGITGIAVQQGHGRLPSVVLLPRLQHALCGRRTLSETNGFSSRNA